MAIERVLPAAALPSAGARSTTTPFQFLVSGEDNLRVRVWDGAANNTLLVSGRAVDSAGVIGVFNQPIQLTGTYAAQTKVFKLAPGYVLSVSAEILGGFVEHGQCWMQVDLVRGFEGPLTTLGTLLQGYVATTEGLAYPGSPLVTPFDGPGYMRAITGTLPAPGAQIAEAVNIGAVSRVRCLRVPLTTNAVVADRYAMLFAQDSIGKVWWASSSIYPQPAATTVFYTFEPGVTLTAVPGISNIGVPIPEAHRLGGGIVLRTSALNMAAGDQWGQPVYVVEEWINPWH